MIEEFRFDALAVFYDLPVFAFAFSDPDDLVPADVPPDVEAWAWRVGVAEYGDPDAEEIFSLFLDAVDTTRIKALLLGAWYGDVSGEGVDKFQQALLDAADRFPALEALFISDVPQELSEISWIEQQDPGDLLAAFPRLRVLGMRGRLDGQIKPFAHAGLEELVLQSGGLPPEAVRAVGNSSLPALTILDMYLGIREYSGGATIEDLSPILSGTAFPELRHLGLRDAENADDLAAALAHAPIVLRRSRPYAHAADTNSTTHCTAITTAQSATKTRATRQESSANSSPVTTRPSPSATCPPPTSKTLSTASASPSSTAASPTPLASSRTSPWPASTSGDAAARSTRTTSASASRHGSD